MKRKKERRKREGKGRRKWEKYTINTDKRTDYKHRS